MTDPLALMYLTHLVKEVEKQELRRLIQEANEAQRQLREVRKKVGDTRGDGFVVRDNDFTPPPPGKNGPDPYY